MKASVYEKFGTPDVLQFQEAENPAPQNNEVPIKIYATTVVVKQDQVKKYSTTRSVILHLLPGILVGAFYFLARQPVANMGYPSIFALFLAFACVLIPVELGYLLYQGKKKTGRFTLQGSSAIETRSRGGNTSSG